MKIALVILSLLIPSIALAQNFQPQIDACSNRDYTYNNAELCEAFYKSLSYGKCSTDQKNDKLKELISLHEQLKHCSITDKGCFEDVVIKLRNLDLYN